MWVIVIPMVVIPGDLNPPGTPGPTMKTLDTISVQSTTIQNSLETLISISNPQVCTEARPPATGQTVIYKTNDDGSLHKGVPWPPHRFYNNNDGTVTDNLTGLIWLKNANKFEANTWTDAINICSSLSDDGNSLQDGSVAGDWRLPNILELESLIAIAYTNPCISNTYGNGQWVPDNPFINIQSSLYWSSTTQNSNTNNAWYVRMDNSKTLWSSKSGTLYVWPVRGGKN